MAFTETNQYGGKSYLFGLVDADAPAISGFSCRSAELKFDPEVFVQAASGEGSTISIAKTPPKQTGTFTGYVTADVTTIAESFSFLTLFFIVKSISAPRKKGEFVEVTIEAEHFPGVTS
jgi:hypothetical protein